MRITKSKDERRAELLEIAFQLLSTQKYSDVRVSDIVAKAQVAQGTFYYYFKTKEEIVYAIVEQRMETMVNQLQQLASTRTIPVEKRLEQIMKLLTMKIQEEDPFYRLMMQLDEKMHGDIDKIRNQKLYPIIRALCMEGMENKKFRNYEYSEEMIQILFEGISASLHNPTQHLRTVKGIESLLNVILEIQLQL